MLYKSILLMNLLGKIQQSDKNQDLSCISAIIKNLFTLERRWSESDVFDIFSKFDFFFHKKSFEDYVLIYVLSTVSKITEL